MRSRAIPSARLDSTAAVSRVGCARFVGTRALCCHPIIISVGPLIPSLSHRPLPLAFLSGLCSFENCWPAIMNKSHGAVLVYSPENEGHVGEVGAW